MEQPFDVVSFALPQNQSVNIFKCLETMELETMNLPQGGNLYVLHLREKNMWDFLGFVCFVFHS